jgi:hypothetical protein
MPRNSHQRATELHLLTEADAGAAHHDKEDHLSGTNTPNKRWNTRRKRLSTHKKRIRNWRRPLESNK